LPFGPQVVPYPIPARAQGRRTLDMKKRCAVQSHTTHCVRRLEQRPC
jgi:hypothetical protein